MRTFSGLYEALDSTNSTNRKLEILEQHFKDIDPAEGAWTVHFLTGGRLKRAVRSAELRAWACQASELPDWLFEECYTVVGDLAETISLVLGGIDREPFGPSQASTPSAHIGMESTEPAPAAASLPNAQLHGTVWTPPPVDAPLDAWVEQVLLPLRTLEDDDVRRARVLAAWGVLSGTARFCFTKLLTGGMRVGVSHRLVARSLAAVAGVEPEVILHRLMGDWQATDGNYRQLVSTDIRDAEGGRPYPFFLASPLEQPAEQLPGEVADWQMEWKWDGIRGQVVRREGDVWIWSRSGELITAQFPEVAESALDWPDGTVVDGELVAVDASGGIAPFASLQRRLGRKKVSSRMRREVPVALVAYDLMEWEGQDARSRSLMERRAFLGRILRAQQTATERVPVMLSEALGCSSWDQVRALRDLARERRAEGLMIKRLDSPYRTGRRRGDWWKWKLDPFTVDAVLIYAQAGHGRRANLHTDYTFAVHDGEGGLVPIAKAYSGLSNDEIRSLDHWIRRNTIERFGPVRSVVPEQVFELAFEGIARSARHKSGIALRFPRISRRRKDKSAGDANTRADLEALLARVGA